MRAAQFLEDLARRGVQVWIEGEHLRFRAPSGVVGPDLRAELARRKPEILVHLTTRDPEASAGAAHARVVPAPESRGEPFPLTDIQQAYWLGRVGGFDLGDLSAHVYLEHQLPGLDVERLAMAWRRLVDRHELLRAVLLPDGRQRILAEVPPYEVVAEDLRGQDPARVAARLAELRERMAREGPPLDRWPLFELRASQLDGGLVRVHLAISLLICDAWSFGILFRDLGRFYADPDARLPPLELSFRDYVLALERMRETEVYRRSLDYWWSRLADLPAAPELPLAVSPARLARPRFARRSTELAPEVWHRFRAGAARTGVTATVALCTAYAQVLAAWSKDARFVLNVLFFKRLPLHPEVGEVVGNFSSTILLEVDASRPEPFAAHAHRLQERLWADIEHSHVTGVTVLRELARRDGGTARRTMPVVFASALNLGTQGGAQGTTPAATAADGGQWRAVHSSLQTPQVWLDHQVAERFGALVLNWDAVEDLFPAGLLDDMFAAYRRLLDDLARDDAAWEEVGRRFVPAGQLAQRATVNATGAPLPAGLLQSDFLARAALAPERPAVVGPERTVTYGELRAGADRLGRRLRELGARPGRLVAVAMDKGWEQVLAVIGVLQAGAAYLPIDPALPAERLCHLIERGEAELMLTQPHLAGRVAWPPSVQLLEVDGSWLAGSEEPPLPPVQGPDELAYVIFTSGSTGLPKGVMIEHRAAANTLADMRRRFAITPEDRVLALSALHFDLSVFDLFGILGAGGTVVLPGPEDLREPARWQRWLAAAGVTIWDSVPALMEMLVDYLAARAEALPASLRLALLSGDWIPVTLPDRIRALAGQVEVVSLGGATEAAVWSVLFPVERVDSAWTSIPYGKPMDNQRLHVLGPALEPRPVWVPGQIYIAGEGLARGYWRDPERTAASFLRHPESGERLYKTGDLGRYLPDGTIEFLGREDFQVKVQGYRIELGEIESTLLQHPEVRTCAAAAVGERTGSKRLVAYAVLAEGAAAGPADLDAFLRAKLPAYMVPSHFTLLPALPLTANGKIDRAALRHPEALENDVAVEIVAPRGELERELAGLWEEILETRPVGVTQSFFDLGGHSLLAVRLMSRLEQRYGRSLPLAVLFEAATVERLAALLRRQAGAAEGEALVAITPRGSRPPLYFVHPVGGDVLCYRDLAARLGEDQPFFALQVPPGEEPAEVRLEDLAAGYVATVRRRQPRGPYRLGGWSMGGVVAYEMARQLEQSGETVALLALLDAERPGRFQEAPADDSTLLAWFARDLGGLVGKDFNQDLALTPERLRPLAPAERMRLLLERVRSAHLLAEVGLERLARLLAVFQRNFRSMLRYEPPPYGGPVHLLRVERADAAEDTSLGWSAVAAGGVEVAVVPGDHYSMMRPPGVDTLAARLGRCLRGAAAPSRGAGQPARVSAEAPG